MTLAEVIIEVLISIPAGAAIGYAVGEIGKRQGWWQ